MTVDQIVQTIVAAHRIEKIILFGSQARGTAGQDSDIDLLVVADIPGTSHERRIAIRRLFVKPDFSMDLFVLTPDEFERQKVIPNCVSFTAAQEGRVLYG
jgi:predicted nucleotidyltransferase